MTKFRFDINALRALAVTAVVGYHYNVTFMPGGFAGVDIFFVISGYLMTDIIVGRLRDERFSLTGFYWDRAKRIIPGLLGLCFALLVVGYFILDPVRYNYFSYTSISAILFYSNILFNDPQGYFSPDHNTKLLLHTWSLSVEWQFYMLYPILLLILQKAAWTRRHMTSILAFVVLVSLGLCIYYSPRDQPTAFYSLPQRAWEMAAGGVVALNFKTRSPKYPRALLAAGLLLIGVAVFGFDRNLLWPSYWAIAPVLGTCLVIAANQGAASPFRNRAVNALGRWSYSIYLWHWPIAVLAVYFGFNRGSVGLVLAELAILAAIILSGALLLEAAKRFRRRFAFPAAPRPQLAMGALAASFAVTLGFALAVDSTRGFANRSPEVARDVEIFKAASNDWNFPEDCDGRDAAGNLRPCRLGEGAGPETLVLGDSFSMHLYQRLQPEQAKLRGPVVFLTKSGCPPVTGFRYVRDTLRCNGFFAKAFEYAAERNPRRIVLIANWFAYFNPDNEKMCLVDGDSCEMRLRNLEWFVPRLDATFAGLGDILRGFRARGAEIVIVSTTPYGKLNVPSELLRRRFLGLDIEPVAAFDRHRFERESALVKRTLVALAAATGASLVEPVDFLCDADQCPALDAVGVPYFYDQQHYRGAAVRGGRFRFFDEAAGLNREFSQIGAP
jgi:peptidoglycan/LPS O-acetylase OafA/YrhL